MIDTPGQGVLDIARVGGERSAVLRAVARSPLRLLVPRNHGHAVWAFQSSLGGGLVDGDDVGLRVRVGAGAAALVTTQASTKVYRSPSGCRQRVHAEVDAGGLLVLLPDAVACFADSRLDQEVDVALLGDASVAIVDALTCGRAACGERWAFACVRSAIAISRDGRGVLRDAVELDPRHGPLAERMGRFDALATIVACGPRAPALDVPAAARGADLVAAASPLADGSGTLVRVAATSAERLHAGVRTILAALPAALGDDPFARKR
jgi:urease accessory protein